ncbi:MAG: TIGR00645 family protein [Chthoniobacter sp.]|nr:TIGR00645 family protein [Chthoniobacter sp.]
MPDPAKPRRNPFERLIFASRWLQAPLYAGLIIAQCVYVYQFLVELWHLIIVAFGHAAPTVAAHGAHGAVATSASEAIMLSVLGLIDVVMIANLLIMVIIGGYETFVSRLDLDDHPDQPEWLSHVNAGVLKVKLATALIGISSIHLLKTFIEADRRPEQAMLWQVIIHVTFVFSAFALAWTDRVMVASAKSAGH